MKNKNKHHIQFIIIFFLILLLVLFLFNYKKFKEGFTESVIPLHIYQTWRTKYLPPKMQECVNNIKQSNPEFEHHLFDDNDCAEFIKNNFDKDVYDAYNSLIPGAYKADLWRYCILYKRGGIYLDIKFFNVNEFKFIDLTDKEYYVRDIDRSGGGVYNALIISKPNNPKLLNCIKQIVTNVENNFYGRNALEPTGPLLLKKMFNEDELNNLELYLMANDNNGSIIYKSNAILKIYKEYRTEQKNTNDYHYYYLWKNHKIYN